jgi:hypothetical protein
MAKEDLVAWLEKVSASKERHMITQEAWDMLVSYGVDPAKYKCQVFDPSTHQYRKGAYAVCALYDPEEGIMRPENKICDCGAGCGKPIQYGPETAHPDLIRICHECADQLLKDKN